jgi:Fe-S-cluster containining protein
VSQVNVPDFDNAAGSCERRGVSDGKWYGDGLRFECTGCGRCCTGGDGYVWMSEGEITALAAHLGLELNEFGRRFLRRFENRYALIDGPGGQCVFLSGKSCSIYDFRPGQCRAFPWWPANLRSPESWKKAADACEGISEVAPVVVADVIEASLAVAHGAGLRQGFAGDDAPDADERGR